MPRETNTTFSSSKNLALQKKKASEIFLLELGERLAGNIKLDGQIITSEHF